MQRKHHLLRHDSSSAAHATAAHRAKQRGKRIAAAPAHTAAAAREVHTTRSASAHTERKRLHTRPPSHLKSHPTSTHATALHAAKFLEEHSEHLVSVNARSAAAASAGAAHPRVPVSPVLVEHLPFVRVTQHLVGLSYLLELLAGLDSVILIFIRMPFQSELVVGLLDFLVSRALVHAKDCVEIFTHLVD